MRRLTSDPPVRRRGLGWRALLAVLFALLLLGPAGCAQTPQESVELSKTVGRDLQSIESAHLALVKLHFDSRRAQVDRFIDEVYAPHTIKTTLDVRPQGASMSVWDAIANEEDPVRRFSFMERTVLRIVADIRDRQAELRAPLDRQEAQVRQEIEDAYRKVKDGHAVVTAHLASVVAVERTQEEFLADVGLEGLRARVADRTAAASGTIADILAKAEGAEAPADDIEAWIEQIKAASGE